METADINLFSYGTLQQENVQLASFGRILKGVPDELLGFRRTLLEITDPEVLRSSGQRFHPIVTPSEDPTDTVPGTLFKITSRELAAADAYEVSDYIRVEALLASGSTAWVYVKA